MAAGTLVSSGTSLNIPSGSGTERLRRATINGLNNDTQTILSGVAGHLYIIVSIIFCDQQGLSGTLNIQVNDGSNDIKILRNQPYPASGTFIWNDRFVLEEDDDLKVTCSTNEGDFIVTYIDQDFT